MSERGWAKARNEKSVANAEAARDVARAKARRSQVTDLKARIGDGSMDDERAKELVRSMVEGDTRVYDAEKYERYEAQQDELRAQSLLLQSSRADREGDFVRTVEQRDAHQADEKALEDEGLRTKVRDVEGHATGVFAFAAVLAVIEALLLKTPFESIARTLFPSLSSFSVGVVSIIGVLAIVLAGAIAVIAAARELKRYHGRKDTYEVAQSLGGDAAKRVPKPSNTTAQLVALVAGVVQLLIFIARFQIDTGDGASHRLFVLVSAAVMAAEPLVGYFEYRRTPPSTLRVSWNEEVITEYLAIDRQIEAEIPHADNVLESRKIGIKLNALHAFQKLAAELGNDSVTRAIHGLIDELQLKHDELRKPMPYTPPSATASTVKV